MWKTFLYYLLLNGVKLSLCKLWHFNWLTKTPLTRRTQDFYKVTVCKTNNVLCIAVFSFIVTDRRTKSRHQQFHCTINRSQECAVEQKSELLTPWFSPLKQWNGPSTLDSTVATFDTNVCNLNINQTSQKSQLLDPESLYARPKSSINYSYRYIWSSFQEPILFNTAWPIMLSQRENTPHWSSIGMAEEELWTLRLLPLRRRQGAVDDLKNHTGYRMFQQLFTSLNISTNRRTVHRRPELCCRNLAYVLKRHKQLAG